jgi:hypothetical protein
MEIANEDNNQDGKKWATFTYTGSEIKFITKLFKNPNLKITYKTVNTIGKLLSKGRITTNKFNTTGIYKLKCKECNQYYIGKTGRSFSIRYKENIRDIKNNKDNIGYANHILNKNQAYDNVDDTMDIIKIENNDILRDTFEHYYIYRAHQEGMHLNDTRQYKESHFLNSL